MSVTRFLRLIEIPQVEGKNTMAVDLFDRSHARRVLAAFVLSFVDQGHDAVHEGRIVAFCNHRC